MSYAQLTYQLSVARVPCSLSDTSCSCAAARGCTRVTSTGQLRGERWQQVTNGGLSRREAGRRRVLREVMLRWLLTPPDGFQLLLLRPFHVYDICTCVAPLTSGVSLLRHFSQNSCSLSASGLTYAPGVECWRLHMLIKESSRKPNYYFSNCVKCNFFPHIST